MSRLPFVEVHAPVDELLDLFGGITHHLLHGGAVADPVAGYHGVFDVLVEVVHGQIGHRGDASLCKIRVGLFHSGLTDEGYRPLSATFRAKLIPAIPEPMTRKSNFLTITMCISWLQNYKISALFVRFTTENPYLYRKKEETMDRVFHARVGAARYLALLMFTFMLVYCLWVKYILIAVLWGILLLHFIEKSFILLIH